MKKDERQEDSTHVPPEDEIARLLRLAGARPVTPADRAARVKTHLAAEWRQQVRARSRRLAGWWVMGGLATAATVILGVRLGLRGESTVPPATQASVAWVEAVAGEVRVLPLSARGAAPTVKVGDAIPAGARIETGPRGRVALRLGEGTSARLDVGTQLQVSSRTVVALNRGAIYIDSEAASGSIGALEVQTPMGRARDIGTRFEVRLHEASLLIRVRDGLVRLDRGGQAHDARAGEELVTDQAGDVRRRAIPTDGPEWDWILQIAPPFQLEGKTLSAFLDWASKEKGWKVRFADQATATSAPTTVLHGSIDGLTPQEALAAILPTCGLRHYFEGTTLVVAPSSNPTTRE